MTLSRAKTSSIGVFEVLLKMVLTWGGGQVATITTVKASGGFPVAVRSNAAFAAVFWCFSAVGAGTLLVRGAGPPRIAGPPLVSHSVPKNSLPARRQRFDFGKILVGSNSTLQHEFIFPDVGSEELRSVIGQPSCCTRFELLDSETAAMGSRRFRLTVQTRQEPGPVRWIGMAETASG
jgi:hypothetical protein